MQILDEINLEARKFLFLELSVVSFNGNTLIIAGSQDFTYYHNFEIHFHEPFTFLGNFTWKANTDENIISIIDSTLDAVSLNKKFKIERGNNIFSFATNEGNSFYVAAERIEFNNRLTKYY